MAAFYTHSLFDNLYFPLLQQYIIKRGELIMAKKHSIDTSSKYRSLIISIVLFSLLVLGIMSLSFYISSQLEKDTKVINTAFEQTSLINQVTSDLYIINSQYNAGEAYNFAQERLQKVMELIDARMQTFKNGGNLPVVGLGLNSDLELLPIDGPVDSQGRNLMNDMLGVWTEYKRRIEPVLNFKRQIGDNQAFAQRYQFYGSIMWKQGAINGLNNMNLHFDTDRYAIYLQELSNRKLSILRMAQIAGAIITALSLLFILFYFIRQLRKTDFALEKAREEANGILSTVREGLFLVNEDRIIGSEYSDELEQILETDDIAGQELSEMLKRVVTGTDLNNVNTFIKVLFDPKVVEDLIGSLNPLKQVSVNIEKDGGSFETKHLSFNFFRVMARGKIHDILVSVSDVTDKVRLQEQLETTKSEGEQQIEMLISFMNANPAMLKEFLDDSSTGLTQINEILKDTVSGKADFRAKIDKIFVQIHKIKGEAGAIDLSAFAEKAHDFESDLQDLKYVTDIKGMDFLPLTIKLDQLISYTDTLKGLSSRLGVSTADSLLSSASDKSTDKAKKQRADKAPDTSKQDWAHLSKLVDDVASDYNKDVDFVVSGLSEIPMNADYKSVINGFCVQLLRNCLAHGIETPEEREGMRKSAKGRIDLRAAELPDGSIELVVRDDGRGFNDALIAKRLVDKGVVSEDEISTWSRDEIIKHVFSQGVSTADVGMHAGRGVGLNVINEGIRKVGGKLRLKQVMDKFCQFEIVLPPIHQ